MKRRLDNEQSYQISMSFAKKFLNEGTANCAMNRTVLRSKTDAERSERTP